MMDFDEITQILEMMREHELSEFELERDSFKLRIVKHGGGHWGVATPHAQHHDAAAPPPAPAAAVHAGASGVGIAAIQIGKALGARIIATAGSEEKLEFCRKNGADHVINYRDDSWIDTVKAVTA